MKKAKNIHNLDSLEREIYRLKLEAKNVEKKLDHNLEHVQENFPAMAMNSFFYKKKNKDEEKESFFGSFLKNEKLNAIFNKIIDQIADYAAEGIDKLLDKIFQKKKGHQSNE